VGGGDDEKSVVIDAAVIGAGLAHGVAVVTPNADKDHRVGDFLFGDDLGDLAEGQFGSGGRDHGWDGGLGGLM